MTQVSVVNIAHVIVNRIF